MYVYLSLVIILSVSSSKSFSSLSISAVTSGTLDISCPILSSFSNNLIAKNLFCSSTTSRPILSSTASITDSTSSLNLCASLLIFLDSASFTAFSAASLIPVPLRAEISTTSQPSFSESFAMLSSIPFLAKRSIILTAIITGIPSSIICVERYKFLSMFVPSTILMIASGLSLIR